MSTLQQLTRSRTTLVQGLLDRHRHTGLRIACEHCGAACVRTGEWLAENPTFMCGRCFQDTRVEYGAIARAAESALPPAKPRRMAPHLPPLRTAAGGYPI